METALPDSIKFDGDDEHILRCLVKATAGWYSDGASMYVLQNVIHKHPDYQKKRFISTETIEVVMHKYTLIGFVRTNHVKNYDGEYYSTYKPTEIVKLILRE